MVVAPSGQAAAGVKRSYPACISCNNVSDTPESACEKWRHDYRENGKAIEWGKKVRAKAKGGNEGKGGNQRVEGTVQRPLYYCGTNTNVGIGRRRHSGKTLTGREEARTRRHRGAQVAPVAVEEAEYEMVTNGK